VFKPATLTNRHPCPFPASVGMGHVLESFIVVVVLWLIWRLIRRQLIDYARLKRGVVVVTGAYHWCFGTWHGVCICHCPSV
jgi:hypothetical protein